MVKDLDVLVVIGVETGDLDGQHGAEALLDLLHIAQGVETEDQVESGLEIRAAFHDGLERRNGFVELSEFDKSDADILDDFETHFLAGSRDSIQSHTVPRNKLKYK